MSFGIGETDHDARDDSSPHCRMTAELQHLGEDSDFQAIKGGEWV